MIFSSFQPQLVPGELSLLELSALVDALRVSHLAGAGEATFMGVCAGVAAM